jgi:two-component system sensor histidine kinase CpxA
MHSLFLRIFTRFWAAMALIVGASIAVTYFAASREYEAQETESRPSLAIRASEVLATGGVGALKTWLKGNEDPITDRELYIVGPDGRDILGRHLPDGARRRLEFVNRSRFGSVEAPPRETPGPDPGSGGGSLRAGPPRLGPEAPEGPPPRNFRPPRFLPQIVGSDGSAYTVLLVPKRPNIFGALSLPGIALAVLAIALVVTALTSWWLAQHFSAPIRRMQAGARALASERLDVRVSAGLEERRDELAVLARDFDAMAEQLRSTRAARTQLLRDISHELRSPLARMRVALGLARQPQGDPARQLDRLEREIERLDSLISQVLKLARLHGDASHVKREPVDLGEIIEEVVRDANFEGAVKHCEVRVRGQHNPSLLGHRDFLHSAIENVLRNAVRYSPEGAPVDLTVATTGNGVAITVADRGPGVPAAELERIFEPFHRVAESRDRDSGGEGIGLAITSQVMRAHGGTARARNRPEGGLEVRLELPARLPAPSRAAAVDAPRTPA